MKSLAILALICTATSAQTVEIFNPDVDQSTIAATICVAGYTRTVRPSVAYTNDVKHKLLIEAGIDPAREDEFELDHLTPLALGGHPRSLNNLALQAWDGPDGARVKDALETKLWKLVCRGELTLVDAQSCLAADWQACAARWR